MVVEHFCCSNVMDEQCFDLLRRSTPGRDLAARWWPRNILDKSAIGILLLSIDFWKLEKNWMLFWIPTEEIVHIWIWLWWSLQMLMWSCTKMWTYWCWCPDVYIDIEYIDISTYECESEHSYGYILMLMRGCVYIGILELREAGAVQFRNWWE